MDASTPPEITPELLEQNPLLAIVMSVFALLVIFLIGSALASWAFIGYRWYHGLPILPVKKPWQPRVWGFADIALAVVVMFIGQAILGSLAVILLKLDAGALRAGQEPPVSFMALSSAGLLATVAVVTTWILLRYSVRLTHLGFTVTRVPRTLGIGAVAGVATLPLILALSALVTLSFQREYEHPLLDALKEDGSITNYLLACFAAVLVAPIAEEFLFRVLIQGWLQSIPFSSPLAILLGARQAQRSSPANELYFHPASLIAADSQGSLNTSQAPVVDAQLIDAGSNSNTNPYAAPVQVDLAPIEHAQVSASDGGDSSAATHPGYVPPIWPSIVTGTLFGLAHWGYGLSFIPLIALGIILGLLYRATQSIWPCILVHFMLNASSMTALGVGILVENAFK